MNYIYKTIKLFINLKDMGYDGTREAKYDFIEKSRIWFEVHIFGTGRNRTNNFVNKVYHNFCKI